jgi:hypothetical protein
MAHIDVRGVHPILFIGMRSFTLEGCDRSITVREALEWILDESLEIVWDAIEREEIRAELDNGGADQT